jgi:hypothetical protein
MKAKTHAKADIYLFNPFSLNFVFAPQRNAVANIEMGQIKTFRWQHRAAGLDTEVASSCTALPTHDHV